MVRKMKPVFSKGCAVAGLLMLVTAVLPVAAPAASLRIEGDRAWLEVEDAPLSKVLQLFEERGVEVLIDPSLNLRRVSGEWENARMDRLIAQLAAPYSYLIERQKTRGPLGELYRISSIRIYAGGNLSAAKPLSEKPRVLDVVEGKGGIRYIRGEIMVGFKEDAEPADLDALLEKISGTVIEIIDPPGLYRIRIGEDMSVEKAMEIANAFEGVDAAEPNLAFPRNESAPVPAAAAAAPNLHLKPGERAVAVLDSGLDPQYAKLSVIRGTYDAIDPSAEISDPMGHGTLSTLVAAGVITPEGAAAAETGVPVVSIRTFDENGMTSADTLMRALEYAAASGAEIVNMSWGSEVDSQFIEAAMNYAAESGMILYASAGNEPTGTPVFPAGYESVIAVGGLNPDGSLWEKSNYGDFVPVFEPAKAVFNGQMYAGTSISSPYAAFKEAQK